MLTVLALCTQLAAAKIVKDCKQQTPIAVAFVLPKSGLPGMLARPPRGKWDAVTAALAPDGGSLSMFTSAAALLLALAPLPGGEQVQWWIATVDQLCQAYPARDDLRTQIAREKANPAGVVDLVRLHELGESLQAAEDDIRTYGEAYAKGTGRPFSTSICEAAP
jgi:hypothetical protein